MVPSGLSRRGAVRLGLGGVSAIAFATEAMADASRFWLLPKDQLLDADAAQEAPAAAPVDPNAPQIIVVSPAAADAALRSPLNVSIRFQPAPGASINPATFKVQARVLGGWFDVTGEIRRHAQVDTRGVEAAGAMLPRGEHRIRVQIADTSGRLGAAEIAFKIV